mgnify:FL=1
MYSAFRLAIAAFCALAFVSASTASARMLNVPVGSEATWVELESGEHRTVGRSVGRVAVDTRRIAAHCRRSDEGFSGYVQLVRARQSSGNLIEFRCLKRSAEDRVASNEKRA